MKHTIYAILACLAMAAGLHAQTAYITLPVVIDTQLKYSTFRSLLGVTGYDQRLDVADDWEYRLLCEAPLGTLNARWESGYWVVNSKASFGDSRLACERRIAFTAFVEPNDVYEKIGVNGADEASLKALTQYLVASGGFPAAKANSDYRDPQNIVNQFVGYHLLPESLKPGQIVVHWNEMGYFCTRPDSVAGIPVSEWYETLSAGRQMLKFSEGYGTNGVRINRFWRNNPDATSPADFVAELYDEGMSLDTDNALMADNGVIYQLDRILCYSPDVASRMGAERMRFDMAALLPELINNNLRRPSYYAGDNSYMAFPFTADGKIQYFDNLRRVVYPEERYPMYVHYLADLGNYWNDMNGDEVMAVGYVDMILKLPPVPQDGNYELRSGVSANSNRAMVMFSFGTNPDSLVEVGPAIDFRVGGVENWASYQKSYLGWEADGDDDAANRMLDMALRARGYMKAPASYIIGSNSDQNIKNSMRNNSSDVLRAILTTQYMKAGETYYLRMRQVLPNEKAELMMDYIELCPECVYDNPQQMEDKW